jgi:hypothetical protein
MRCQQSIRISALLILAAATAGCDQLGLGGKQAAVPDGAPEEQALQKIAYMSSANSGVNGRKVYTRLEEAKTCADLELAMRWNRPPGVESGPFHQKMVYLSGDVPADLPAKSEIFLRAIIEDGQTLPSGAARWFLRMKDGTRVQAIEDAGFYEKQEQASQPGQAALVEPNKPKRTFCGNGVYQGVVGKDPDQDKKIPLVAVLFAMDRKK